MGVMRADLLHALHAAGFRDVDVRTVLSPAWTSDWISEEGRRKLADGGIAPPGAAPARTPGPVPLQLGPPRRTAGCPQDRKSTRLNSSHANISYAVFCL